MVYICWFEFCFQKKYLQFVNVFIPVMKLIRMYPILMDLNYNFARQDSVERVGLMMLLLYSDGMP